MATNQKTYLICSVRFFQLIALTVSWKQSALPFFPLDKAIVASRAANVTLTRADGRKRFRGRLKTEKRQEISYQETMGGQSNETIPDHPRPPNPQTGRGARKVPFQLAAGMQPSGWISTNWCRESTLDDTLTGWEVMPWMKPKLIERKSSAIYAVVEGLDYHCGWWPVISPTSPRSSPQWWSGRSTTLHGVQNPSR